MGDSIWQNGTFNEVEFERTVERIAEATFNPQKPWGEFKAYKRELGAYLRAQILK
jgi:hypothetical protein